MATEVVDYSEFGLSNEEKDKLVAEVIRYVLFKTHQSSGCPIKREELTQIVSKNYRNRNLPAHIINEAKHKIANIFGYEMKELQRTRVSTNSQQSSADARSYIITSKLPAEIYRKYVENEGSAHLTAFNFVVLSLVHLSGGKMSEEDIWHQLTRIGLNENDGSHPLFGNLKQALDALAQQRYLNKEKVKGPEGITVVFELAERALDGPVIKQIQEQIQRMNKDVGAVVIE